MNEKTPPKGHADEDHDALIEKRIRMRFDWQNLIEDLIEDGRQQGVFDNLPGKGKPLKLNQSAYGRELELAHDLLKHNDLKPAWITLRQQIKERIDDLRQEMRRTWHQHEQAYRFSQNESQRGPLRISWDDACQKWTDNIRKINAEIIDFNLRRPSDNLELFILTIERELERLGAPRWLKN